MKRKRIIIALCLGLLITGGIKMILNKNNNERVLTLGLGSGGWGSLFPAQYTSLYAVMVTSHIYESLVGVDNTGGYIPNLASTWEVSKDFRDYIFVIDTNRKFSNGTPFTANIYKKSLLHSLQLEKQTKIKALDLLYLLEGFSEFESTGNVKGIEVEGDNILRLKFTKPFRRAIELLNNIRYAAYLQVGDNYIGTGPYIYDKISKDDVRLKINPYYPFTSSIKHIHITSDGLNELHKEKIDAVFVPKYTDKLDKVKIKTEQLNSLVSIHRIIRVNGMNERIFSDKNLRQAAQYIIYKNFKEEYAKNKFPDFMSNLQFYSSLYPGHLDEGQEEALLNQGSRYVNELREKSQTQPIVCCLSDSKTGYDYCNALEQTGIHTKKKIVDFLGMRKMIHETYEADLVISGISYTTNDPDGLYYVLGKNSMFWSPMFSRPKVEELLEQGRSLTDPKEIDSHYQNVSRAILEEVPMIHLGSQNDYLEYNADVIKPVNKVSAKRNNLNMTLFEWK